MQCEVSSSMACLEDLPDEILLMILSKLRQVDVLYSLVGVNERFDRLVDAMGYTRAIELLDQYFHGNSSSRKTRYLDRFCGELLPLIGEKIESLTVEPLAMESVLGAVQYPHLQKLTLVNFGHPSTRHYFTAQSPFVHLFAAQIRHLNVSIDNWKLKKLLVNEEENVYSFLSSIFPKLVDFHFTCHGLCRRRLHLPIDHSCDSSSFFSNVVNMRLDVDTLDDCFRLLDGRLIFLRQFFVRIQKIECSTINVSEKTLSNLQCFSLISSKCTKEYDRCILPLLQRMVCLEKLTLCLSIVERSRHIDGFHLKNEIFLHMPLLRTFEFEISTSIRSIEDGNERSNTEFQETFRDQRYGQVFSYIKYKPGGGAESHIFSLPYTMDKTLSLNSHFPGSLLLNIRSLLLSDTHYPFEHHFFLTIAQSFPSLTNLTICNQQAQRYKQLDETNHPLPTIEFSRLNYLFIICSHVDYLEEFLLHTKTRLPRLTRLSISYEHLQILTEDFTRDATRRNCAQINSIEFHQPLVESQSFSSYFPSLKWI